LGTLTDDFMSGLSFPARSNRREGVSQRADNQIIATSQNMKFICMSYLGPVNWENMSASDRQASMDEFFAYDAMLRKNGHLVGGEGLQDARKASTLRFKNGKVALTDGPYAETKEVLAGFFILEARDMDHAVELMSKHPVVKGGAIEIRPAADGSEMASERERRSAD
jgi:hypothetical protein